MERLKNRSEFLRAAKGRKRVTPAFVMQMHPSDCTSARIGYTVTKRTGNAVERNRIRRRLREAVRLTASDCAHPGHDYVLIGRRTALKRAFADILEDMRKAFAGIHRPSDGRRTKR